MKLKNKKILLGISGSIAAYKAPIIVRELIRAGAEVKVAMTKSALKFVTKDVLINLTRNPVAVEIFDEQMYQDGAWHIHLAHWCDAYIIAPASASTLSKLATGNCDNTVSALYVALPRDKKAAVAPAMDHDMFEHPTTQRNIKILLGDGTEIIQPDYGELSSGIIGKGRLPEPTELVDTITTILSGHGRESKDGDRIEMETLPANKYLITAGPTREKIDDVRYISNFSTGKMGVALANKAIESSKAVTLILGPVSNEVRQSINANITIVDIETAVQMMEAAENLYNHVETIIMTAAVADYRPVQHKGKLKKGQHDIGTLQMIENPDILKTLSQRNRKNIDGKKIVGFALESQDALENAKKKLIRKGCNLLVLNRVGEKTGFGSDTNKITILSRNGVNKADDIHSNDIAIREYEMMTKEECAAEIIKFLETNQVT